MKKIACLILSVVTVGLGTMQAQGEMDAYKLSQTDVTGTARSLSMGGAFGALGGDASSMWTNPAGLGIYRSSEIVGTLGLNIFNTTTDWTGNSTDMSRTRFNLENFSYIAYFPTGNYEGLINWNVGFSYNKLKNFNRRYRMRGNPKASISDYIAAYTSLDYYGITPDDFDVKDPYARQHGLPWLSVLGYEGYLINPSANDATGWVSDAGWTDEDGVWQPFPIESAQLEVQESGGIDQYNFSFATNISNVFFVGATLGVTDLNYRVRTYYEEDFGQGDYLKWHNALSTDGSGIGFNIGMIVRPTDFLRLGIAYNSPTWYKLTDYYYANSSYRNATEYVGDDAYKFAETPTPAANDYKLRTPDKWIFSAAAVLGTQALISVDYELSNFRNTRFYDVDGGEFHEITNVIKEDYQIANTIKVGAEYKITPQFAVRAGANWQTTSAKKHLQNNEVEVLPTADGTLVNFTVDRGIAAFSLGLGYRFTPNFYMDLAYVYRQHKENAYAFSNIYSKKPEYDIVSEAASLKTNTSRIALTLGYKF